MHPHPRSALQKFLSLMLVIKSEACPLKPSILIKVNASGQSKEVGRMCFSGGVGDRHKVLTEDIKLIIV